MRPSRVAAATSCQVLTVNTTGVVTKSSFGAVNQSVGCRVFGSSATIALAYPPACALPAPTATSNLPSVVNAMSPTGLPPFVFQEVTVRGLFAAIEIAHTPFAALPHPWLVDV